MLLQDLVLSSLVRTSRLTTAANETFPYTILKRTLDAYTYHIQQCLFHSLDEPQVDPQRLEWSTSVCGWSHWETHDAPYRLCLAG
jgi:hypothetical protein